MFMKKKFINGLLLVTMIVGATSSLVSCKDYDDEKNASLQEQMFQMFEDQDATLRTIIQNQADRLEGLITTLRTEFETCRDKCTQTRNDLNTLTNTYNNFFNNDYTVFKNNVLTNYVTKTDLRNELSKYYTQTEVDNLLSAKVDSATFLTYKADIENRISYLENLLANYGALADTTWVNEFFQRKGNYVTTDDFETLLESVLDDALNGGGSGQSISEIINNYLNEHIDLSSYLTGDSIMTLLSKYTTLTEQDVRNIINTYNYLDRSEIVTLIESYHYSTLTEEDVKRIVSDSLANYYTKPEVDNLLNQLEIKLTNIINNVSSVANAALNLAKEDSVLIENLYAKTNQMSDSLKTAYDLAQQNSTLIQTLTNVVNVCRDSIQILDGRLSTLETNVSDLNAKVALDSVRIDKLEEAYQTLKDTLANYATISYVDAADQKLNDRIDSILTKVVPELKSEIQDARDYAEQLADSVGSLLTEAVNTLNNTINTKYQELMDSIAQHRTELNGLRDDVNQAMQDIKDLRQDLDDLTTTVGDLNDAFTQYCEKNDARVKAVEDDVEKLKEDVENINKEIENIKQELAQKVDQDKLAKMITGIIVNGTYNPAYGTFNTPLGVRSNVLIAYHGYVPDQGATFEFPTIRPIFYADQTLVDALALDEDEAILETAKLAEGMDGKVIAPGTIIAKDGGQGNAGKIYLTVNPAEQDFTGVEPLLITSKNYAVGMELSPIRKSNDKLTYGWTRAAENKTGNGFYETDATVSKSDIYNTGLSMDLDLASVKEVVNDVKNWRDGVDLSNVVSAVYNNVTEVMNATAVKVQYNDEATGELRAITSDYELGATVMKPLSYKTLDGIGGDHVPGIGRVERLINRLFKTVSARITLPKLNFVIKELNLKDLSLNLGRNGKDYTINYTLEFDKDIDVDIDPITITSDKITVTLPQLEAYSFQTDADGNFMKAGGGTIPEDKVDHVDVAADNTYHAYDASNNDLGQLIHVATTYTETKQVHPDDVTFDPASQTFTITVSESISIDNMNQIVDDFYGEANAQLGKINSQVIDKINAYIHDVVGQLYDLQKLYDSLGGKDGKISSKLGEVKSAIIKYLERFNKRFAHLLTPNSWMQPVMLAETDEYGLFRMPQSKSIPIPVKGTSVKLWPTTYNAEILTPAYRKYVVCTNAYNEDGTKNVSARDAFNNSSDLLNTVQYGEWKSIDATIQTGYTYEVLYMAVDFHGIVTARKYYMKGI